MEWQVLYSFSAVLWLLLLQFLSVTLHILQGEDKGFQVCRKKMATSAEVLCKYNAPEFCKFTEAVLEMKFDEEPKYAALISLFEPILVGCVHKPICVDIAIKVRL